MFLFYYIRSCMINKSENNRCGQKLIDKSLKNCKKEEMIIDF